MGKTNIPTKEFKVTLAHKRSDRLNVTNGVHIQPKLDGVRCYTRWADGEVKMFSRNHKEFKNCKHITTQLSFLQYYPELVLDGELYNHRFKDNFNKIISLVRKSKPTQADKFESASLLQYHVYDVFNYKNTEINYSQRFMVLNHLFNYKYKNLKSIKIINNKFVKSEEEVKFQHLKNLHDGYEGSMLRSNNEAYQQRRSHGLQKVKDFHDTEFTITGYVEGNGKFEKGLGKFLGVDKDGREIEVPWQKLTMLDRRRVWATRTRYLGKVATFSFFERTPDGAYRFPQFKALRNYE